MNAEMKTYRQWMREGRTVKQGEKARAYLMDDDFVRGSALFAEEQTEPNGGVDEHDQWSNTVSVQEYQRIKSEARKLRARPVVRVDEAKDGGVSVWVGPNKDAIKWLKEAGYRYSPKAHRWLNINRQAEMVAQGWETKPEYRVIREWLPEETPTNPAPEGI